MGERVLLASCNPWSFCMAVERDMARMHSEQQVDALNLFSLCSRQSPHWRPRDKLIETLNRKFDRFVGPVINGRDITGDLRLDSDPIPPLPNDYDALRAYELDGARVGLAALSTVCSLTTIQYPASLHEYGAVLPAAWRSAHRSLRIGQAVQALGYDKVVIFNGRHCYSRPFCEVLDRESEVIRYEQGSAGNRYIFASVPVHEPENLARLIQAQDFDPGAGEAFFRKRLERHSSTEVGLYTATQRPGALPPAMKAGKAVVFFTSSSDEMAAITDNPLYGAFATQSDVALAISEVCSDLGLQAIVRLHPHLRFKHPAWKREWDFAELERRGVMILPPDDPADSYAMVRTAHSVVTSGSTIGIEASYLGVPNAVVGTWVGGCLGASMPVETASDLRCFVAAPALLPQARERALLLGSFYESAGRSLPELDVATHPNLVRIDGRVVDRVRYPIQKLRMLLSGSGSDPSTLDIKSGIHAGRVVLATGTDYSSALRSPGQGKAARSGSTNARRAATENSRSRE